MDHYSSFAFLSRAEKTTLILHLVSRCLLAGLDLLGMILLGVTASIISGNQTLLGLGPILEGLGITSAPNYYAIVVASAVLLFLVKGIATLLLNAVTANYVRKMSLTKMESLFSIFIKVPTDSYAKYSNSEIRYGLGESITSLFAKRILALISLVAELFTVVLIALVLAFVNFVLFLYLTLALLALAYFLNSYVGRKSRLHYSKMNDSLIKGDERISEYLASFKQTWPSGKSLNFAKEYLRNQNESLGSYSAVSTIIQIPKVVIESFFMLALALVVLQRFFDSNAISAEDLGIFAAGAFRIIGSLLPLQAHVSTYKASKSEGRLAAELLSLEHEKKAFEDQSTLPNAAQGEISLLNVSYKYPGQKKYVLHNVSLRIRPGEHLAIVGKSGSGKSTLADVLAGLKVPNEGIAVIGAQPIREAAESSIRIAYVPQEVSLFQGSLGQNVALSPGQEFDEDQVAAALSKAQCDTIVSNLDDGIHSQVGDGFSGGEIQRIGLARAYYINPDLLILDEVTSSLDQELSLRISETFSSLEKNVSLVVIAHNLETLASFQRIILIEENRLLEFASLDDLKKKYDDKEIEELIS